MKNFKKDIYRTTMGIACVNCVAHDVPPIGTQVWTGCNATVETYRDLTSIPQVTDNATWAALTTGAWCWYNNDPLNEPIYGKLYNWYAVAGIYDAASLADPSLRKQFAPDGYRVPSDADWTILTDSLGGVTVAGGPLKEEGYCHWNSPNINATNTSLFTGLPGGIRSTNGSYGYIGTIGNWWSSTENNTDNAWYRGLSYINSVASRNASDKTIALSVRFIKETCPDVTIGDQVWTKCNLNVDRYRDGTLIPEITVAATWAAATSGAWCYYNFDSANGPIYGKLYNAYAINDSRGLVPTGYHIPTVGEFETLKTTLGASTAGGQMKETGTTHWFAPNTGATNNSGFTGLGGGLITDNGFSQQIKIYGSFWTSSLYGSVPLYYILRYNTQDLLQQGNSGNWGYSVRLIKD
jgi:uncharacterized protein (TIGR02145 family)